MSNVPAARAASPGWLERASLQRLVDLLGERGYEVHGPVVREGSIVFDRIQRMEDLPVGWRDTQEPGRYRLEKDGGSRVFGVVHGAGAIKRYAFAPRETLLQIRIEPDRKGFEARPALDTPPRVALLGVRACDLAGLEVQDRVFLEDRYPDTHYASRRSGLLLIAADCTRSVSTCFCVSMGTGPEAAAGYDLALTELDAGFILRAGSEPGNELLDALGLPPPPKGAQESAGAEIAACAAGMSRKLDTRDLPGLLYENLEHPRWDDVAARCLSCGNCTMACPTCFCHDERDEPSLDGLGSVRIREWDSCFNREHAQVHGMNFRPHVRERYRQWLVHKLASWIDQFGTSGCVGCGRCITWCPVGIDITEELAAIREGTA